MPGIVDTYVSVFPETARLASGIRDAIRDAERTLPKVTVQVDADTSSAEAQIDAASRDRRATIEIDADTLNASAQRAFASMATSATSAGTQVGTSMGAGLTPALIAAGVTALAGIASAASGALGLVPAALAGAGTSIGTLVLGLDGVKEAWDAAGKASESAGQEQADQANAVASAQQTLRNAIQDEANAQKDVADARRDARQQLEDLNVQLRGGALNEKQAALDVAAAQRDLAQGRFRDSIEAEQAVLRVQQAEQRQIEVRERNEALVERSNDANRQGVEGSDQVVAANQRLATSQQQIANAQASLNDAQTSTSTSAVNAAAAMAALSPQAQVLVQTLQGLKPMWDEFQGSVQDSLLEGIGPQIAQLAQTYLPMLQGSLGEMAGLMNEAFGGFAEFLQQPATMSTIQTILDNVNESFRQFMPTMDTLGQAFLQLTATGTSFLPQLGQVIDEVAQGFSQFVNSGSLGEWIQIGLDAFREFTPVAFQIMDIFRDMAPIGMALLPSLGQMFAALQPAIAPLSDLLAAFITNGLTPFLTLVAQLNSSIYQGLAPALTQWFQTMGPIAQTLMGAFLPVLQQLGPVIGEVALMVVTQLAGALQQITPYIGPIAGQFADLLSQLIPMIPALAQLMINFSPIFQAALPALTQALLVVLPIVNRFLELLTDLADFVVPKLQTAITVLGDVFGVAWETISGAVTSAWTVMKPVLDPLLALLEKIAEPLGFILDNLPNVPGFERTVTGTPVAAPGGRAGAYIPKTMPGVGAAGGVPLTQNPDGTWTSPSPAWADLIERESGGINQRQQIIDSNSGGNEAEGLFQITPQTWAANGGTEFAPSALAATPEQQAIVAARIFQRNPSGSDWGAGLPGRESPAGLAAGLQPMTPNPNGIVPGAIVPGTYGLAPGTDIRQGEAGFPDWVYKVGEYFGLKASTYSGHQEDRGEGNQGIDWWGPVESQQAFADYLAANAANIPGLEDVIWQNPTTGRRLGVNQGRVVGPDDPRSQDPGYFRGDWADHNDHVHTTQQAPIPVPGSLAPAVSAAMPDSTSTMGAYPVLGTESAPMYVDYTDGSKFGKDSGGAQLGQDFVGGIMEIFGIDGSVFPNFMNTGMFKTSKALMSFATGLAGGGQSGGGGASLAAPGGDLLGGALNAAQGFIPQAFGQLNVGGQDRVPTGSVHQPGGAPGPGAPGAGDYRIQQTFNGPVGSPGAAFNAARDANIPRMRQGMRPLPK